MILEQYFDDIFMLGASSDNSKEVKEKFESECKTSTKTPQDWSAIIEAWKYNKRQEILQGETFFELISRTLGRETIKSKELEELDNTINYFMDESQKGANRVFDYTFNLKFEKLRAKKEAFNKTDNPGLINWVVGELSDWNDWVHADSLVKSSEIELNDYTKEFQTTHGKDSLILYNKFSGNILEEILYHRDILKTLKEKETGFGAFLVMLGFKTSVSEAKNKTENVLASLEEKAKFYIIKETELNAVVGMNQPKRNSVKQIFEGLTSNPAIIQAKREEIVEEPVYEREIELVELRTKTTPDNEAKTDNEHGKTHAEPIKIHPK